MDTTRFSPLSILRGLALLGLVLAPLASAAPSGNAVYQRDSQDNSPGGNQAQTPGSSCITSQVQEGDWNCISPGNSFQRCASGVWSVVQYVAAGTECAPTDYIVSANEGITIVPA